MEAARATWIAEGATAKERAKRAESYFLAAVDAEGRRIDFHALRTTCGTWLDQAGVAPSVAKRVTGHSNERTLMKHYHRATDQQTRRAIEALPSVDLRATGTDDPSAERQQYRQQRVHETVRCDASQRDEVDDSPEGGADCKSLSRTKKCDAMRRNAGPCESEGDGTRTRNLRIDSPVLYPIELHPRLNSRVLAF